MEEKKYTQDGYLIVSELSRCPYFEQEASAPKSRGTDCFFCKFSDFRKREYIERIATQTHDGILFSVCHNEQNKRTTENETQKELKI